MLKRVVTRRLPGFRFEADAPLLAEVLPRMDVACFVGFAASGPLDVPVAVESVVQFNAIFGADAPLAWDARQGAATYAYLAPAVRAFFTAVRARLRDLSQPATRGSATAYSTFCPPFTLLETELLLSALLGPSFSVCSMSSR